MILIALGKVRFQFFLGQEHDIGTSRLDFFYIGKFLGDQFGLGRCCNDRCPVCDQGDRSMLQFSGSIRLGMDVRDLLEF